MPWFRTEYLLKGVFLGLLLNVALRQASADRFNWAPPLQVLLCAVGGVVLALFAAALNKLRAGYRIRGRLVAFILFLLLESPTLVYGGILIGTLVGMNLSVGWGELDPDVAASSLFVPMTVGGAVLGLLFGMARTVRDRQKRLLLCLVMAGAVVAAAVSWFGLIPVKGVTPVLTIKEHNAADIGWFLIMGLPLFYLLTFAGVEEETEIEVAAMCATLGVSLALITGGSNQATFVFLLPVGLYFWYTIRILPGLRVFKHVLRGMSHSGVGRFRPALLAFRRALQLDPNNAQAREEFWKVHVALDFDQLRRDPGLLELVDFRLCVERAGQLLLSTPTPQKLADSNRLLDLVLSQKPNLKPAVDYWRAVALTHERRLDEAAELLIHLLDPEKYARKDAARNAVLMQAWQLVLMLHDELRQRVGLPQLALPGRRMEAIMAIERHLAENPSDDSVWPLKRQMYQDLSEQEFEVLCVNGKPPEAFDYAYCQQLGAALIEDPTRWPRGAEYLRMAARGLPLQAPTLYAQVAQAYERAGNREQTFETYALAKKVGLAVGHKSLAEQERQTFFRLVKLLGEEAMAREDLKAALENFHLYSEYERSGVETLRTIAELHERRGDALAALRVTDRGLVYNAKDADFLQRKDRYYYSVSPDVLRANLESAGPELDLAYCAAKAKSVLDHPDLDLDGLDWAEHLIDLALVVKPNDRTYRVLKGRAHWRRGDVEQAASVLEGVRTPKPEKFAGADDEEAWYAACQLLGDLYLNNLGRPDDAIACLQDYRKSPKAGARTYYRLGQAYEQKGDVNRAVKCYQQVTAYDGNPLQPEAQEALYRLGHP